MSVASNLRRRFEFVPGQHRPHPVRNGLVFLGLIAFALYCGYSKDIPLIGGGGQEVKAIFPSANNIIPGNQVRVQGVEVGVVDKVERAPGGRGAQITMRIKDDKGITVKRDAAAQVYWRTLLGGNFYVELEPGSRSAPAMPDGGTIPMSRTTSQVEFDQLLTAFDGDARTGIQTSLEEFKRGFADPAAPRATIEELSPALRATARGLPGLRGTRPGSDLPDLARGASRALGALARSEAELAGLVEHTDTALAVTAARSQEIGSMLEQAPATLADTTTTMTRLRTTLAELDPVADDLRPGARRLAGSVKAATPAMDELARLVPSALPFLRDIDPAVRSLRRAAKVGVPLMDDLNPTLVRTAKQINPFLNARNKDTKLKNAWAIGPFFASIGSTSSEFDELGHVQNFQTQPSIRSSLAVGCEAHLAKQKLLLTKSNEQICKNLVTGLQEALTPADHPKVNEQPVPLQDGR
jgi:virulence factor Mce-like protein